MGHRSAAALLLGLAAAVPLSAAASTPPVPPLDFRLDDPVPAPEQTAAPQPEPAAEPRPRPTATVAPERTPSPRRTTEPGARRTTGPEPAAARTASARPVAERASRSGDTRQGAPAPAAASPTPGASDSPVAPTASPGEAPTALPTAAAAEPVATTPTADPGNLPAPLPPPEPWRPVGWQLGLALLAGLAALASWLWLRHRARRRASAVVALIPQAGDETRFDDRIEAAADSAEDEAIFDEPEPDAPPEAAALPEAPATPDSTPGATAALPRPDAHIDLTAEIREVEFTLTALVLRYAVTLTNDGATEARGLAIRAAMIEAGPGSDAAIDRFFKEAELIQPTQAKLAPGAYQRLENELRLPLADLRPMVIGDRPCVVPLLAFAVRHDGLNMGAAFSRRAWIVGREADPPRAKMAPFRLDRGPRRLSQVGLRIHRES